MQRTLNALHIIKASKYNPLIFYDLNNKSYTILKEHTNNIGQYDYIDKMMLAASNSPIRDVIQNAYNEWTHQLLLPLSMKYKWAVEEFDCDLTNNGEGERKMGAPPSEDY